jgi:hypothetical protein
MYPPLLAGAQNSRSVAYDQSPMIPQSYSYRVVIASDLFRR